VDQIIRDVLLDPAEVAKRLGCSRRQVEVMVKAGEAPPNFTIGRLRRFPESGVSQWIADRMSAARAA